MENKTAQKRRAVIRPTLREVEVQLRRVRREGKLVRGRLRKTGANESETQIDLNNRLQWLARERLRIVAYLSSIGHRVAA